MPIPTNRTTSNTPAEHVSDHNLLHAFYNSYEGFAPSAFASATHTHDAAAIVTGQLVAARLGAGTMGVTSVLRGTAFSTTLAAWGVLNLAELGNYQDNAGKATGYVLTLSADLAHYSWQPGGTGGGGSTALIPGLGIDLLTDATSVTISAEMIEYDEHLTPGTYTWTKPVDLRLGRLIMWAGGGSGAPGGCGPGDVGGGGGGAGGALLDLIITADLLPPSAQVVVGAGGALVAGRATAGAGANGNAGADTTFWDGTSGLRVQGGGAGIGGLNGSGAGTAATGGAYGTHGGGPGAAAAATGGSGVTVPGAVGGGLLVASAAVCLAPAGGPSGGGLTAAGTQHDGMGGTYYAFLRTANAGTQGLFGGTRNGGAATVAPLGVGASGGSGASSDASGSGAAGDGGASVRGFGGAGGGASRPGGQSGDGSKGGDGGFRLIAYR